LSGSADASRGISMRLVEITTALGLFCIGAWVIFDSLRLGSASASGSPPAGFFPFYIGSMLCLCAGLRLFRARAGEVSGSNRLSSREGGRRVLQVLVASVVYVCVIELIGFYVASAILVAVYLRGLGRRGTAASIGMGGAVMAAMFLVFEVGLAVPLYQGLWNPLAFLGY
jgi:hypothetical protein